MMYRGERGFQAKSITYSTILKCSINRFLEYSEELTTSSDAVCEDKKAKIIKEHFNTLSQIY
ncbi:MAG: hypothetical protein H0X50_02080 [Nitrosopumilus sp.]|nr:hypothetical protein [Nitrosopumilus sp.]